MEERGGKAHQCAQEMEMTQSKGGWGRGNGSHMRGRAKGYNTPWFSWLALREKGV